MEYNWQWKLELHGEKYLPLCHFMNQCCVPTYLRYKQDFIYHFNDTDLQMFKHQ